MCKVIVGGFALLFGLYGVVEVKLGDFTLTQHVMRIARTDAVHDLGSGIVSELNRAQRDLKRALRERLEDSREDSSAAR